MNVMQHMTRFLLSLAESGFIPDVLIKIAARHISTRRLNESNNHDNKDAIINALSKVLLLKKHMMPMSNIMKFHLNFLNKFLEKT